MAGDLFISRVESNIRQVLDADQRALVAAMRRVVTGRAKWGQGRIRRDIVAAGYGTKIPNAVRMKSRDLPDGVEATIFSSARVRRAGGVFDLIALFQRDVFISPINISSLGFNAKFLSIPNTAVVGRTFRGRLPRVGDYPSGTFIAKATYDGGVLVLKTDPDGPPYFFLAPYARQRPRLDLTRTKGQLGRDLSGAIVRDWRRRRVNVSLQLLAAA